jgi:hypothetical protein
MTSGRALRKDGLMSEHFKSLDNREKITVANLPVSDKEVITNLYLKKKGRAHCRLAWRLANCVPCRAVTHENRTDWSSLIKGKGKVVPVLN